MAILGDISAGLADQLSTIVGLRFAESVPDAINPPAGFIHVTRVTEAAFGYGSMEVTADAVLFVSSTVARIGHATLLEFASTTGPRSVWTALAANPTLGLTGVQATIVAYRSLVDEVGGYRFYGGAFEIQVTTP